MVLHPRIADHRGALRVAAAALWLGLAMVSPGIARDGGGDNVNAGGPGGCGANPACGGYGDINPGPATGDFDPIGGLPVRGHWRAGHGRPEAAMTRHRRRRVR